MDALDSEKSFSSADDDTSRNSSQLDAVCSSEESNEKNESKSTDASKSHFDDEEDCEGDSLKDDDSDENLSGSDSKESQTFLNDKGNKRKSSDSNVIRENKKAKLDERESDFSDKMDDLDDSMSKSPLLIKAENQSDKRSSDSEDEVLLNVKAQENTQRKNKRKVVSSDSDEDLSLKSLAQKKKSQSNVSVPEETFPNKTEISSGSEDEVLTNLIKKPSNISKRVKNVSDSDEEWGTKKKNRREASKAKISKSASKSTSRKVINKRENKTVSSSESDDEALVNLKKKLSDVSKKSKVDITDSDEDFVPKKEKKPEKKAKTQKSNPKLKKNIISVTSSEDETLANLEKEKPLKNTGKEDLSSDEEDIPLKQVKITSLSEESKTKNVKKTFAKKTSYVESASSHVSSDEDNVLPKEKTGKKALKKESKIESDSDSDNQPLAFKSKDNSERKVSNKSRAIVKESEEEKSSDLSSDDAKENDSPKNTKKKYASKGKKTKTEKTLSSASLKKIEHMKKYLRVAGIHVTNYNKLFENCKTVKSKVEKLLELLQKGGLKGKPTLEKCKKLKKKIETKKEVEDLDTANIIRSEGRPKRGMDLKVEIQQLSPATIKKYSRLMDIIDTEESD